MKIEAGYARESNTYIGPKLSLKDTFVTMASIAAVGAGLAFLGAAAIGQREEQRAVSPLMTSETAYGTINTIGIVSLVTGSPVEGVQLIGMAHGAKVAPFQPALKR